MGSSYFTASSKTKSSEILLNGQQLFIKSSFLHYFTYVRWFRARLHYGRLHCTKNMVISEDAFIDEFYSFFKLIDFQFITWGSVKMLQKTVSSFGVFFCWSNDWNANVIGNFWQIVHIVHRCIIEFKYLFYCIGGHFICEGWIIRFLYILQLSSIFCEICFLQKKITDHIQDCTKVLECLFLYK